MAVGNIRTLDFLVNTSFANNSAGSIGYDDTQDCAETLGGLPWSDNSPVAGTTYTAALIDRGTIVEFTSATAVTYTIPANATVAFPVGCYLHIRQNDVGQVTITPAGGVTLRSPTLTYTTRTQWSRVSLWKRSTNEWVLEGDLS